MPEKKARRRAGLKRIRRIQKSPNRNSTIIAKNGQSKLAWQWVNLRKAYAPKRPMSYLVRPILPLPSLNILYGEPGSLKTMLAMDLAFCVVAGKEWLSAQPGESIAGYQSKTSPVLWIDVDNGNDLIERRFKALGSWHQVPKDSQIHFTSFPPFALNKAGSVKELVKAIKHFGARLVIFDNLGTISGGTDENSSHMIGLMGVLRKIAERTRSAIVVIHHTSKAGSLRGHSSINAAVDLALLIEREADTVKIRSTKTRHAPIIPFKAQWDYISSANGELIKGGFYGLGQSNLNEMTPAERLTQLSDQILSGFREGTLINGMNQTDIVKTLRENGDFNLGRNLIRKVLDNLESKGKLMTDSGLNNSKLYSLSGE